MIDYKFNGLIRVEKKTAKQIYDMGYDVLFIPCKCNPTNDFYNLGIWENRWLDGQLACFEHVCNHFEFYNCNNELGKYIAFYISDKNDYSMHFMFTNGSNPYLTFANTIQEQLKIYKKWKKEWAIIPDTFSVRDNRTTLVNYRLIEREEE